MKSLGSIWLGVGSRISSRAAVVGRLPEAEIKHAEAVATMFGHVPLPFFNLSVPDRPLVDAADLRRALAVAQDRAKSCRHGSMIGVCEDWAPENWEAVAAEAGFSRALNLTWMTAGELLPPRRTLAGLEFRRVSDEATARDLATINAQAYGMPQSLFECICNLHLWREDSFGYVGYAAGGQPVTAASAFPVAGTMYIALVATLPGAHGKGYAEAVMRQTIEWSRPSMGVGRRITLHASDMGAPV